jgi:amino acid transporter
VILAVIWYVIVVLSVGLGLGQQQLETSELATADAMGNLFGSGVFANILILGGVFGILTSWNGFLIGGSRLIYAMAHSGMLPGWLGRLHPRYRTPTNAILVIGLLSFIAPFFGREMLIWLVDAGSMSIVIAYLMVAISFLVLRRREPECPGLSGWGRYGRRDHSRAAQPVLLRQYLPGMPAGLIWPPEWAIVILWWIVGLIFIFRMDTPQYNPEL